jgi:lysylphosphatidylglycerol synthetase-like protein (DUF2156 family)
MATATVVGSPGPAVVVAGGAVLAVLAGVAFRPAATLAVLLAVTAIALGNTTPILVAISGLSATVYLVLRHTAITAPTVIAAGGFTFVGLVATAFPLQVPWLPLVAPLAALGCYVLAVRPFLGDRG